MGPTQLALHPGPTILHRTNVKDWRCSPLGERGEWDKPCGHCKLPNTQCKTSNETNYSVQYNSHQCVREEQCGENGRGYAKVDTPDQTQPELPHPSSGAGLWQSSIVAGNLPRDFSRDYLEDGRIQFPWIYV